MAIGASNIHLARRAAQGCARRDAADLPNAMWLDPEQVFAWKDEIPRDRPAVVYCARVTRSARGAATLCALGLDARYLVDGSQAGVARCLCTR